MIVTRFNYSLPEALVHKLDLLIDRFTRKNPKSDAVLINEGAEGGGKTTLSVAEMIYVAEKTGREFNHTHVWFDLQKMIDYLKNTEGQLAIWDEPALHALSKDAMTKVVRNLERLLLTCRKKRHFLIINVAYFNRFNDYIVWQRPNCMIHLYQGAAQARPTMIFIRKKKLEKLWNDWKTKKRRNYFKYADKWRGNFSDILNPECDCNVLSMFNMAEYDKAKDNAISSIGVDEDKRDLRAIKREWCVNMMKELWYKGIKLKQNEWAAIFKYSTRTIKDFAKEIRKSEGEKGQIYYNNSNKDDNDKEQEENETKD